MTVGVVDHSSLDTTGDPARLLPLASDRPVSRALLWGTFAFIAILYALLWTSYWYPLSDSSLYLVLARGLFQGRGLGFLKQVHRDVRPLTPILLYLIMKAGGGIGAMHVVMTALTLLSHVLAFLTLRRWFNERIALLAVVVMASSWWVFANAFTVMTEPLFLVMFWGCLLVLEGVPRAPTIGWKWGRVVLGALLLLGAFENRIAGVLLIPGTMFGLWMHNRNTPVGIRLGWMAVFCVIFTAAYVELVRPAILFGKPPVSSAVTAGTGIQKADDDETGGPDTYKLNALVNVTNPLIQLPVSAGRWISEGLAAATEVPFGGKMPLPVQYGAGIAVFGLFLLTCAGWFRLLREKRWYAVGMAVYFFPLWIMWGNRIKPRYMIPILPMAFIQLWAGAVMLLWTFRSNEPTSIELLTRRFGTLSRWVAGVLFVGIIALNVPPYAVDVYMRRQSKLNFYDIARRGAFAELVDIGSYLQKHSAKDAGIWMNWGPNRRVVGFLADRDFKILPPARKRGSGNLPIHSPADTANLSAYFKSILKLDKDAEWAVVFYDQNSWPNYHLPLAKEGRTTATPPRWWQLYHRERRGFVPVPVPVNREDVRNIPGVNIGAGAAR